MALSRKMDAATPLTWDSVAWDAEPVDISSTDYTVSDAGLFSSIYVGGAGDVTIKTAGGNNVTYKAVPAGTTIPQAGSKVIKATTTATNMLAMVQ